MPSVSSISCLEKTSALDKGNQLFFYSEQFAMYVSRTISISFLKIIEQIYRFVYGNAFLLHMLFLLDQLYYGHVFIETLALLANIIKV